MQIYGDIDIDIDVDADIDVDVDIDIDIDTDTDTDIDIPLSNDFENTVGKMLANLSRVQYVYIPWQ